MRIEQVWRGLPVYDSVLVAEQENTGLLLEDSIDGDYVTHIEEDISTPEPSISESEAITIAKAHHGDSNEQVENVSQCVYPISLVFIIHLAL